MARKQITPVHPGTYLKEMLAELKLSQYRLAQDIGVTPMRVSHVVRGQRPVTAELALRLGRYFRQTPRFWLNLQSLYDLRLAQKKVGTSIKTLPKLKQNDIIHA